ncbi:hypothetical protein [Hugenholtzia roseola]|uniref:hypothetical protein n=1 Tax=Hugenholtzia roseola TaxID=1002 RepID=UPI00047D2A96|nr:hypothetical protein [Hugenholtzia roseola]
MRRILLSFFFALFLCAASFESVQAQRPVEVKVPTFEEFLAAHYGKESKKMKFAPKKMPAIQGDTLRDFAYFEQAAEGLLVRMGRWQFKNKQFFFALQTQQDGIFSDLTLLKIVQDQTQDISTWLLPDLKKDAHFATYLQQQTQYLELRFIDKDLKVKWKKEEALPDFWIFLIDDEQEKEQCVGSLHFEGNRFIAKPLE